MELIWTVTVLIAGHPIKKADIDLLVRKTAEAGHQAVASFETSTVTTSVINRGAFILCITDA